MYCGPFGDDSVPHFAAEQPYQAAVIVTTESRTASTLEISRSCR